jgi:hypothetical protein
MENKYYKYDYKLSYLIQNIIQDGGHINEAEIIVNKYLNDRHSNESVVNLMKYFINNMNIMYNPLQQTDKYEVNRIATFSGMAYFLHNLATINELAINGRNKIIIDGMNIFRNDAILFHLLCSVTQKNAEKNKDVMVHIINDILKFPDYDKIRTIKNTVSLLCEFFLLDNTDIIITIQDTVETTGTFVPESSTDQMNVQTLLTAGTSAVYLLQIPCYFKKFKTDKSHVIIDCHKTQRVKSEISRKITENDNGNAILGFTNLYEISIPENSPRRSSGRSTPIDHSVMDDDMPFGTTNITVGDIAYNPVNGTVKNEADDVVATFITYYFSSHDNDAQLWSYDNYDWLSDEIKKLDCFKYELFLLPYEVSEKAPLTMTIFTDILIESASKTTQQTNQQNVIRYKMNEITYKPKHDIDHIQTYVDNMFNIAHKNNFLTILKTSTNKKNILQFSAIVNCVYAALNGRQYSKPTSVKKVELRDFGF